MLCAVFRNDLESIKTNLGLPKYAVGQAVEHAYRDGLRGVIIDVDLQCAKGRDWVHAAGCLERGCALGFPGEETDIEKLKHWINQVRALGLGLALDQPGEGVRVRVSTGSTR